MSVFFIDSSKRAPLRGLNTERCRVTAWRLAFPRFGLVTRHRIRNWIILPQRDAMPPILPFGVRLSTAGLHVLFSLPESGGSMAPQRILPRALRTALNGLIFVPISRPWNRREGTRNATALPLVAVQYHDILMRDIFTRNLREPAASTRPRPPAAPCGRACASASMPRPRSARRGEGGFPVLLDGKPVRTPAGGCWPRRPRRWRRRWPPNGTRRKTRSTRRACRSPGWPMR